MFKRFTLLFFILLMALGFLTMACGGDKARSDEANNGTTEESADQTKKEEGKDGKKHEEKNKDIVPVETAQVSTGDIASYILLSANLETERMTDVYSRVQGLVDRIELEEGDYVKRGQLLLELEPDELRLREAKAHVDYEQEKTLYERKQQMFEKQLLSKEEFETASYAVRAKKILWQEAKLSLDHTKVTSPISGVIGERMCRVGDRIQPTDKLFTVINNEEMIAVVHVPEREVGIVRKDQKAFITSQHLGGSEFQGWIKRVSPVVDPQSGTFKVTVGIRNQENLLRPGMFVNVHVITDVHTNTVLIPKTAIVYENERMQVFVVQDSVAKRIDLDAGFQDYEKVESLSGIDAGDKVIVVGQAALKDGAKVKIVAEREIAFETAQVIY